MVETILHHNNRHVVIDGKVPGDRLMNRPPYTHTPAIVRWVAAIGEALHAMGITLSSIGSPA